MKGFRSRVGKQGAPSDDRDDVPFHHDLRMDAKRLQLLERFFWCSDVQSYNLDEVKVLPRSRWRLKC